MIKPRLVGGQSFTGAEVIAAGQVAIELVVLVEGLVVGGLTFVLDPQLKWPAREFDEDGEHENEDEEDEEERYRHEEREKEVHEEPSERREKEARRIRLEIDLD